MSDSDNNAAQTTANPRRRKRLLALLAVLVILGGGAFAAWHLLYGRWYEETDDAYVDGNVVDITPQVAGTVVSIHADDGDLVQAGQPLVELDPADAEVALRSAEANLARTVRNVRGLFSNVDGYQAEVESREVDLQRARNDFQRRQKLAATGAISKEELAHARDALAAAESALRSARQQFSTGHALVDGTQIANHPDVQAAAAQLRQAYLDRARTTLPAPVTGYVAKRTVQVGSRVQPGTPLMAVIPLEQVWIDANFKETQLRQMRIGQPVEIHADLYGDDVAYQGHVESLGVGTGSAFSLLPAQNASGNWIKIVQRLPVRIALDPQQLQDHPLRIGLSTRVSVDLHDQDGPVLAAQPRPQAAFSTEVYARQAADADALIARLIQENAPQADAQAAR